jgi:hypothetical protein
VGSVADGGMVVLQIQKDIERFLEAEKDKPFQ